MATAHVALSDGAEFERIREIARALGETLGPIGDDTAAVPEGVGQLVVSTDTSVERIHFRREWMTPREIGWRGTAAALSDLAAVGADPAGITVALTVPAGTPHADVVELMRGAGDVCTRHGTRILGGDLTGGDVWSLTVTVLGHAPLPLLSRRGARSGDSVWVTGRLGGARAALTAWQQGAAPLPQARCAFVHPEPRIDAGRWLARHGATAMLDLSDGLAGDVRHLAAASRLDIAIDLARLPLHPDVAACSAQVGQPAAVFAALGGEDYELLVTMPNGFAAEAIMVDVPDTTLTRIGTTRAGDGSVQLTLAGDLVSLHGFVHAL